MHNVLATGGAGFIGSNFVRFLLQAEPLVRIVTLDILSYAGSLENLLELSDPTRHTFVRGDICDRALVDELLRKHQIDTIVHFAAETHVDRSIFDPHAFLRTNVIGTWTLLEAARQYWLVEKGCAALERRFHHISTDEVFGALTLTEPAWTEDTPYAPNSPYAASKASADHWVRAYGHTYGLPFSMTNCSNNYGPRQFPEKLIPLMISNALEGKPLPVYGDGAQIRDWLYVEDHCEAIWNVLRKGKPGVSYNIGGGSQPKNIEVVEHLCTALDEALPDSRYAPHRSLIRFVADRPGHDRRYAIDISKVRNELEWQPRQSLGSGLQKTVDWYLAHPDWMAAIRQQQEYQTWLNRNYTTRGEENA
jgi:dTDP-glucose 4,6-dehydratase